MSVLKPLWIAHTRRRSEKCQLVLTPLPVHEIGLEKLWKLCSHLQVSSHLKGRMLHTSAAKSDERSWQYPKEQWVTTMHVALMDIKEWQWEQTDNFWPMAEHVSLSQCLASKQYSLWSWVEGYIFSYGQYECGKSVKRDLPLIVIAHFKVLSHLKHVIWEPQNIC